MQTNAQTSRMYSTFSATGHSGTGCQSTLRRMLHLRSEEEEELAESIGFPTEGKQSSLFTLFHTSMSVCLSTVEVSATIFPNDIRSPSKQYFPSKILDVYLLPLV